MACLVAQTNFDNTYCKTALPIMKKMLIKDSSVNKQIVAEAIAKLGYEGENFYSKHSNQNQTPCNAF